MGIQQLSLGCSFMKNVVTIQWHTRRRMTSGGMSQESEVITNLGQPKEEKLSGKRKVFYFYDIPPDMF